MTKLSLDLRDAPFSPAEALEAFTADAGGAGGIVTFSGHVRLEANGAPVQTLYLQAYSPMTERGIESAMQSARVRWRLIALTVIHRTGAIAPGEAIVFVAAASAHRRAAFEAADFMMDYLKTEAVFWKKEIGPDGARWIEPRAEDYADNSRWKADYACTE